MVEAPGLAILVGLELNIVGDSLHAVDAPGDLLGAIFLHAAVHEAAQLDGAAEGFNLHVSGLDHFILDQGGLHLGGEGGVIDVFARALAGRGGTAGSGECNAAEQEEGDKTGLDIFHVEVVRAVDPPSAPAV